MSLEDDLKRGFDAFGRGDYQAAANFARKALRASPKDAGALTLLGRLAMASMRYDVALSIFNSLAQVLNFADPWIDLAEVLVALRREQEAAAAARRATDLQPDSARAWLILGDTLASLDERDAAADAFRRALAIDPTEAQGHYALCRVSDVRPDGPEAVHMRALLKEQRLPPQELAMLHAGLAITHRRAGDDSGFIQHVLDGNAVQRAWTSPDRSEYKALYDRFEAAFTKDAFARAETAAPADPTPIFIVGMPRSGTTLVEQILGGAQGVATGSEIDHFKNVTVLEIEKLTRKPFPEGFDRLTRAQLQALAAPYTHLLRMIGPGARFVTDKTPYNFNALGLLVRLFPNAKVIVTQRDPMDTCFSILQQPFGQEAPHTFDVGLLAYTYARHERLIKLWDDLAGDRLVKAPYEALVANPRQEARRIFDYCGLTWDDSVLEFDARQSAVHTFSAQQVRRSVYTESVGAWRKFERELSPLRDALAAEGVL